MRKSIIFATVGTTFVLADECQYPRDLLYRAVRSAAGDRVANRFKLVMDKPAVALAILRGNDVFDNKFPRMYGRAMSGDDLCKLSHKPLVKYIDASQAHFGMWYDSGPMVYEDFLPFNPAGVSESGGIYFSADYYSKRKYVALVKPVSNGMYYVDASYPKIKGDRLYIGELIERATENNANE